MKLSQDEISAAQQALAEHAAATTPQHTDTSALNDYTKSPTLWNGPRLNITEARRQAHARITACNLARVKQD